MSNAFEFRVGDRIKVIDGNFENLEGKVREIDYGNGHMTLMLNVYGRDTPVELESRQIESILGGAASC